VGLAATARAAGDVAPSPAADGRLPASPAVPAPARALTIHARWTPSAAEWGRSQPGDHTVRRGVILDGPGGEAVGELTSSAFAQPGPFGPIPSAAAALELQTLRLEGGTLFGLAAPASGVCEERAYAVLGGTGQFSGVRGSYVERPGAACGAHGASDSEFTIHLV
jgi:hypothetical protein